ncbi:GNAT family N-acetyltransferase [Actinoplanes sp. CA-131856]
MELFASVWWAAQRTETEVHGILAGSDVVVAVLDRPSGRLVGFARALTDRTYLAVILDVIVASDVRGAGVGSTIMDAVLAHPWIAGVKSVELICQPDLTAFYRRWGFTDQVGRSRLILSWLSGCRRTRSTTSFQPRRRWAVFRYRSTSTTA